MSYPEQWIAEDGEECVTFFEPETGAGALQISAYQTPTYQNCEDVLIEYLSDNAISLVERNLILQQDNSKCMASYNYQHGPWFKRVWFIGHGKHILLITYNCKIENQGMEDQTIKQIVSSVAIDGGRGGSDKAH